MCWKCDRPKAGVDDVLREVGNRIRRHGWAIQYVESDCAPYAYTIGLHRLGLPEVLVSGLNQRRSEWLLDRIGRNSRLFHRPPVPGVQMRLPAGSMAQFLEIPDPAAHLDIAVRYEGIDIRALQIVWTDERGRWPWDRGYDAGVQPVWGAPERLAG